jgi:methionyl-tRNA formyltransferase
MTEKSKITPTSGINATSNLLPQGLVRGLTSHKALQRPKIVFFGNERIATGATTTTPVLKMLRGEGYDIAMIIASDSGTRSRKNRELEVETFAREHSIPFYTPRNLSEIQNEIAASGAPIGVLVAYGHMVPESIISLFPLGIVNIHPSALPLHRGSIPLEAAMLAGETETAVSLMSLVRAMDAGPVYAQTPVTLTGSETKQTLADHLLEIGAETLRTVLPKILSGECVALPQDDSTATYDERIDKADGVLDFTKSATQLEREVRAYAGWPGSRTVIAGKDVVVTNAHESRVSSLESREAGVVFGDGKQLCIQSSDGVLVIDSLKPAGKPDMPAAAFLAGYGSLLDA